MKLNRRTVIIILIAVVVVAAIVHGFMPKPVPVETASVIVGDFRVTIDEEGKTRVIERFVVSAPVTGFARRALFDVGDEVKKGQTVVVLDPQRSRVLDPRSRAEAKARVSAAKAGLNVAGENAKAAEAEADYARSELERMEKLFIGGFVPKVKLDQAQAASRSSTANYRAARSAVNVAKGELEAAKTALGFAGGTASAKTGGAKVTVRAPVGGRVLKIYQESEGAVVEGAPLIELGDPGSLEVVVDVLSEDSVRIKKGTAVVLERWGGDEPLNGRVKYVEPAGFTEVSALGVKEQRVLVVVEITSKPELWQRLGDGFRVEASFILWQGDSVLQVPSSAVFRYKDGFAVFTVEGNRARRRVIKTGHQSGLQTEVLSGIDKGAVVIKHPDDEIDDGVKVKLR